MIYCVSDIHSEILRWKSMLERIQFSDNDTMYVLGDVIDRTPMALRFCRTSCAAPMFI